MQRFTVEQFLTSEQRRPVQVRHDSTSSDWSKIF